MTYFRDLSPYEFLARSDEDRAQLNVGWLSPDHPFLTAPPDRRLVRALFRCAMRPERLCRGYHVCELGCGRSRGQGMLTKQHQGRKVELGNGEVRVTGPDGRRYTAPTLVAHYVADHGYAPPQPFAEGVMRRAREIRVLRGEAVERIGELGIAERFALCLDALRAFERQHPDPWLAEVVEALRAASPALDPGRFEAHGAEIARMKALVETAGGEGPIAEVVHGLEGFFRWAEIELRDEHMKGWFAAEASIDGSVTVLERLHEAGLQDWQAEMTPSRWDEAS